MDITKFFLDNIYNPEYGAKPAGVAVPLLVAGLGSLFGLTGGIIGALGGLLLSPVINNVLGKIGQFLGLSAAPVPGGVPKTPDIAIGEGKPATEERTFSLHTHINTADSKHIRAPILENMKVPAKDIRQTVESRRQATEESVKLANLPTGTNKNLEERVHANWEHISRQEKEIGDFVSTMKNYQHDQVKYAAKGGEREKLVANIASHLGIATNDANTLVPALPEVPKYEYNAGKFSANPLLQEDYMPTPEFEALYYKRLHEGKLPKAYGNKKWHELDTLSRLGYAFNQLNEEIVAVKRTIDVNKINPDGKTLGHPDFNHCNWKRSWTCFGLYDDGSEWTRQNAASVVTNLLARNPDDFVAEWGSTGTRTGSLIQLYADEAIKVSSSYPASVSEYQKIKHYAELTEKRRLMLARIEYLNKPIEALSDFRINDLTKSELEAEKFIKITLPAINQLIDAKADYETAGLKLTRVSNNNDVIALAFSDISDATKTYTLEGSFSENGEFTATKINGTATTSPVLINIKDVAKVKTFVAPAKEKSPVESKEEGLFDSIAKAAQGALKNGVKFTENEKVAAAYPFVPAQPLPFLNLGTLNMAA